MLLATPAELKGVRYLSGAAPKAVADAFQMRCTILAEAQ